MNSSHLLSDKLTPPFLPEVCLPRPALMNLFERKADRRILFVSAPAGYGKTVSTLLWCKHSKREIIWINLDEYDNAPPVFFKLLCTGILSCQPNNPEMSKILKSPDFASTPIEHTIRFITELMPDDKQYALILDGMRHISDAEIRQSGFPIQKRLPSSFVLAILTRNEVKKESVITGEKFSVITAGDLAFSREEISKYFNAYGHSITSGEVENIHAVTGGWPVGIHALATNGQKALGENADKAINDYIGMQIWDKLDEKLRTFVMKTAVVDEMTVDLCKRLTGCENSKEILEELCFATSLIQRNSGGHYRIHSLFLKFLRKHTKVSELRRLEKTAALYYLDEGKIDEARRHAIRSGDEEAILRTTQCAFQYKKPPLSEYVQFLKTYCAHDLTPDSCKRYPFLYASHIWLNFLSGEAAGMHRYMDKLYECYPVLDEKFPPLAGICRLLMLLDNRFSLASRIESLHRVHIETPLLSGTFLTLQAPFFHRSILDFSQFSERGFSLLCTPFMDDEVIARGIQSGLYMERNRIKDALHMARAAYTHMTEATNCEVKFSVCMHLAEAYSAMGDDRRFENTRNEVRRLLDDDRARHLQSSFAAYNTNILLKNGDKDAALRWLKDHPVPESRHIEIYMLYRYFTTARAYMVLDQSDRAMALLQRLKRAAAEFQRPLDIAEAGVLLACLQWSLGLKKNAQDMLITVLLSMQEYGFVRVITNEGASVLPILKKPVSMLKKGIALNTLDLQYVNTISYAAYEQSKRFKGITANIRAPKPMKLSKQQQLVVSLLSKGYKNAEIAEMTGLTIHTVKSHCAAAYAKLEVNNAPDAVLRAKELGFIE